MKRKVRKQLWILPLIILCSFVSVPAHAIIIHYVNSGPQESLVYVGFNNDANGWTTTDLNSDNSAFSRNDTAYGPLPPAGQPANFDSLAFASAELGTVLNSPTGTGTRTVFSPLSSTFLAQGQTLQSTGQYSSESYAHSGTVSSSGPTPWIIHVAPSPGETLGTPTQVTIEASIAGVLSVAGASQSDATWDISTTSYGSVMSGSANQVAVGSQNFNDSGLLTFVVPLGSTFELLVDYNLFTSGAGVAASSTSEITSALVAISAQPAVIGPAPLNLEFLQPVILWPPNQQPWSLRSAFELTNPDLSDVQMEIKIFSNERHRSHPSVDENLEVLAARRRRGLGRYYILMITVDYEGQQHTFIGVGGLVPRLPSRIAIGLLYQAAKWSVRRLERQLAHYGEVDPTRLSLYEY